VVEILAKTGDITTIEADAIVNPANTKLLMGGGVAGALKRAGGEEIENQAIARAPVKIGEAVSTKAGRLKAKYIIHAPTMDLDFKTDIEKVRSATRASLKEAERLKIKSIAIPALGAGVGGLPRDLAARAIVEEIRRYRFAHIEKILLVDRNDSQREAFERALKIGMP